MPVQHAKDASNGADERDIGATGRDEAAADRDLAAGADERQDAQDYKFAALDRRAAVRDRREAASRDRTSAADDRAAAALDRAGSATDRVLATNQLRDATTALAAIINSSNDAVVARSLDGIITTWNDGATLLTAASDEDGGVTFGEDVKNEVERTDAVGDGHGVAVVVMVSRSCGHGFAA